MSPSPLGAHYRTPLGAFYRTPLGAFGPGVGGAGTWSGPFFVDRNLHYDTMGDCNALTTAPFGAFGAESWRMTFDGIVTWTDIEGATLTGVDSGGSFSIPAFGLTEECQGIPMSGTGISWTLTTGVGNPYSGGQFLLFEQIALLEQRIATDDTFFWVCTNYGEFPGAYRYTNTMTNGERFTY